MSQCLFGCFSKTRDDHRPPSDRPTWRQLLESSGMDLWNIRKCLASEHRGNNEGKSTPASRGSAASGTILASGYSKPPSTVCVLSMPTEFRQLEDCHGLDKINGPQQQPSQALPLTKCTGQEWERQRNLVRQAFSNILPLSLTAANTIRWNIEVGCGDKIDLKEVVLTVSLEWLIRLFCGKDNSALTTAVLSHWKAIRARNKQQHEIQSTYMAFVNSLTFHDGGLLQELYSKLVLADGGSGPTEQLPQQQIEEAKVNSVFAMIAAFDAVQSLVFWTLWNLSKDTMAWEMCRESILRDQNAQQESIDIEGLKAFKKQATQLEEVDLSKLSMLARALTETVRVYPPIWTLPRSFRDIDGTVTFVKLDVLAANGATNRQWNPNNAASPSCSPVSSFGVGKRHCPAGTAALVAAYVMLRRFIVEHKAPRECDPGKAVASAYLGPTLCTEGPQFFWIDRYPAEDHR